MTQDRPLPALSEDTIDDLLYFSRTADTASLAALLASLSAAHSASVSQVLVQAVDPDAGNTALHMSAANGHLALTKQILSYLPRPQTPTERPHPLVAHRNAAGNTALHWAALNGSLEVVKLLVLEANADPTERNLAGRDAVYEAEANNKAQVVEWLLAQCEGVEEAVVGRKGGPGEEMSGDEEVEVEAEVSRPGDELNGNGKGETNGKDKAVGEVRKRLENAEIK